MEDSNKTPVNIDYIMELLDWNNSIEKQKHGVELAKDVKCISVFMQPGFPYGKNMWDNCAVIISERSDSELHFYLCTMMEWLQDMNWPGAFCIMDRLKKYKDKHSFENSFKICVRKAKKLEDEVWLDNLYALQKERNQDSLL